MDSVEGGSFIFWKVFLSPEVLTRAPKARTSTGVFGHALPENFANLGSLNCHLLHFDIIPDSPSAEIRKFGFMAHLRGTAETCLILIFEY